MSKVGAQVPHSNFVRKSFQCNCLVLFIAQVGVGAAGFWCFWGEPGRNGVLKIDWAGGRVRKPRGCHQGTPGGGITAKYEKKREYWAI